MSRRVLAGGMGRAALTAAWACVLAASACRGDAPAARYTVRGAVENLTEARGEPVALIRHEAIPDFVDGYGEKRTMHSMAMAFGIDRAVSLAGIAVGDQVEVTFLVDRERYPSFHVTALRELPAGTELTLSR
jgi:Copper binding periplasmic protein CusF